MYALAEDSRNDVASNIVALVCGLIGMIHFILFLVKINKIRLNTFFHKLIKFLLIKIYEIAWNVLIFLASNARQGKIKQEAIVIDPIGAILISIYIIIAWILQANSKYRLFSFD
jgi:hypothetical protein